MTRIVFTACIASMALATQPAAAQVSTDDYFSQSGGAAGCYDPAITSPERQRLHQSMGTPACRKSGQTQRANPPSAPPISAWRINDRLAYASDNTGLGIGVVCIANRGPEFIVFTSSRAKARLQGVTVLSVLLHTPQGYKSLTVFPQPDGTFLASADMETLNALKSASMISVSSPKWTARFAGSGSSRAIAQLPCTGAVASSPAPAPVPVQQTVDTAWLAGGWVPRGGRCASGDALIFQRNGGYSAGYAISGRWALAGNRLTIAFRESEPDDEPGPEQRVTQTLGRIGANELSLDRDRYKRCPANGGVEPWYPRERFTTN